MPEYKIERWISREIEKSLTKNRKSMKRLHDIYPLIFDIENLKEAHKMASKDKGTYREVKYFKEHKDRLLPKIQDILINHTYFIREKDYKLKIIVDKGKERELMKLCYNPHRIIQWAIMLHLEKMFVKTFCYHSCASVVNGGAERAHKLVTRYLKDRENTQYCLKIDVKKFYPSINKDILKYKLRTKIKDRDLIQLLDIIIDSYPREKGIPIGSYLSQYFANFYLTKFDHWCKEVKKIKYIVRYMDDIVILHKYKEFLHSFCKEIQKYWETELDLKMKENYQVFPVEARGIDFVGFVFRHDYILLRKKNVLHLRKVSNSIKRRIRKGHKFITQNQFCSINSMLGFFQYFDSYRLYNTYILPIQKHLFNYHKYKLLNQEKGEKELFKRNMKYIVKFKKKRCYNKRNRTFIPNYLENSA